MKKPTLNYSKKFELGFTLSHPGIPKPCLGYAPDWEKKHGHLHNLLADHRHCPALMVREQIGITLKMPYTCRFFRNRRVEIETYWEESGPRVITIEAIQQKIKINPKSEEVFPGFHAALPGSPHLLFPIHIFLLGDIRVNAWIAQSGVHVTGLPKDYSLILLPLNYGEYPKGVIVGQALVYSLENISGQLKIPVDLDFSELGADQEYVEIKKGTPMVQYLPIQLPEISLKERFFREVDPED